MILGLPVTIRAVALARRASAPGYELVPRGALDTDPAAF